MINKFTILPVNEIRIIKKINIITPNQVNRDIIIGFILYERKLTKDYKFRKEVEKKKEFDNLIEGYPKQENFPNDELDEIILTAIQNQFPNSNLQNHLIVSTSDEEWLENLKNRPNEPSYLTVQADFSELDLYKLSGEKFNFFSEKPNVYVQGSSEMIKNLSFFGTCDFGRQDEIFKNLEEIKFL